MDRFVDKVAVVTGASRGIGEKIAKELLKRGVNVVGIDIRTDKIQALSKEIAAQPKVYAGKFYALTCDLAEENDIKETFSKIKAIFGTIAILVNNAAKAEPFTERISDVETQLLDNILDLNVRGYVLCANEAVKLMADSMVGGHIVNINSIISLPNQSLNMCPVYTASKSAVRSFTDALRHEMVKEKRNIKVSTISPSLVNTDLLRDAGFPSPEDPAQILIPEDVANGCIAILNTPPNVVVLEYTLVPKHCMFQ